MYGRGESRHDGIEIFGRLSSSCAAGLGCYADVGRKGGRGGDVMANVFGGRGTFVVLQSLYLAVHPCLTFSQFYDIGSERTECADSMYLKLLYGGEAVISSTP